MKKLLSLILLVGLSSSLFSIFLSLLTSSARAQEIHRLEPIIVSADRLSQPLAQTTSSVTVISLEELSEQHPTRVEEILRGNLGLQVNSSGTVGETTSVRLRGCNSDQTLVVIDGQKVNSPWNGAYGEWGSTGLEDIGRIEIIRGTQSELYGSEAMGGVVSLFTKQGGQTPGGGLSFSAGSFDTFKEAIELRDGKEKYAYFLSAAHAYSGGQFQNDDYDQTSLCARFDGRISSALSFRMISRYREAKKELAVNPDELSMLDPQGHQWTFFRDNNGLREDLFFLQTAAIEGDPFDFWHYQLNLGYLNDDRTTQKEIIPQTDNLFIDDVVSTRLTVGTQHDFSWSDLPNTFSLGLEYEEETASGGLKFSGDPNAINQQIGPIKTSDLFDTIDKNRHTSSLFFQNRLEAHPLTFTAGLRWDNNSAYGQVWSPRLSQALAIDRTKTRLKTSWAQGFRAPTFKELYFCPSLFGNPELKPEKNTSIEIGFDQTLPGSISLGCTYFHNSVKDLISKQGQGKIDNIDTIYEGVEGEITFQPLSSLAFQIGYTYLDTEDKDKSEELTDRPHHTFRIAADYRQGRCSVHPVVQVVSSERASGPSLDIEGKSLGDRNPGYTRADLTLNYELPWPGLAKTGWQSYVRVNNLLDEKYSDMQGFPAPGINFLAGLKGSF